MRLIRSSCRSRDLASPTGAGASVCEALFLESAVRDQPHRRPGLSPEGHHSCGTAPESHRLRCGAVNAEGTTVTVSRRGTHAAPRLLVLWDGVLPPWSGSVPPGDLAAVRPHPPAVAHRRASRSAVARVRFDPREGCKIGGFRTNVQSYCTSVRKL